MGRIHYLITANNQDFIDKMEQVKGEIRKTSGLATSTAGDFGKLGTAVAGAFSVAAVSALGKEIVKVRGDIQALEQSFNVLAGTKGGALFEEIRRFAVETPLGMQELAKSAQTLLSFNVEAERVMPLLRQIGDVSMGDAQKMQSLTLAFAQMSSTGKLMGQDLLQMINAGFNPLSVISEKTGKSIGELRKEMENGTISAEMVADAFATATGEGGKFNGMLEQQSEGIRGMMSNFEGTVEDMLNKIGEQSEGLITGAIGVATDLVENYEQVGKVLLDIVAAYGAYKAATIAVSAVEVFRNKVLAESVVIMSNYAKVGIAMSQADAIAAAKTKLLTAAKQSLINVMNGAKAALTNPYVLATAAVAGLIFGIYKLVTAKSAEEKAQERVNEQMEKWNEEADKAKTKTEELTRTIENESATNTQKYQAWKDLIALWPELKEVYTQQEWAALSAGEKEKFLAEQTEKRTEAQLRAAMADAKARYNDNTRRAKEEERGGDSAVAAYYRKQATKASLEFDQYNRELNKLLDERRKAEWEAQPIEVKLVTLDGNITELKGQIAEIDRLIAAEEKRQSESGFVSWGDENYLRKLKDDRDYYTNQMEEMQIQRRGLESSLAPKNVTNIRKVLADIRKAQAAVDKARKEYAKSSTTANEANLKAAEDNLKSLKETLTKMTGMSLEKYLNLKLKPEAMVEDFWYKLQKAIKRDKKKQPKVKVNFKTKVDESELIADDTRSFEREQEVYGRILQAHSEYVREYGSQEAKRADIVAYYNREIQWATSEVEIKLLKAKEAAELFNLEIAIAEQNNGGVFKAKRKAIEQYYGALIAANTNLEEQIALLHQMEQALSQVDYEQAQQVASYVGDMASAFSSLGDALGNDTLSDVGSTLNGLANAVGNVMTGFASGGPAGAIIAAVTSVVDLATQAVERYYQKMQEGAQLLQDEQRAYADYFQEVIDGATSATEAVSNYNESLSVNDSILRNARGKLSDKGYYDFARMDSEGLQAWMRENMEEYNDLPEYVKTHIQTIIDAEGTAQELKDQLQEKLTGISFDSVRDKMRSALLDGTKSVTDSVSDMMRDAIADGISNAFSEDWAEWYDDFYKAMSDGTLTEEEAAALKAQAQAIYDAMKAQSDAAMGIAGIASEARSAKAGAVTQASQDSIDYMNGQLTLGNHTLLSIDTHLLDASATLTKLLSGNAIAITHLASIAKNTDSIPAMANEILRMRSTLDSISTHGLKMKA